MKNTITVQCTECDWNTDIILGNETNPTKCPECQSDIVDAYTGEVMPVFFRTIWDFAKGADISNYQTTNFNHDDPKPFVFDFKVMDDHDCFIDYDNVVIVDGVDYVKINWGDSDTESYIKETELQTVLYGIYVDAGGSRMEALPDVFRTEEEAQEHLDELLQD